MSVKFDIYMACPVCLSEGYNSAREYWRHAGPCKGLLALDEWANIICRKCRRKSHITKMRLKCCNGRHDFVLTSVEGYAAAISTSSHFVEKAGLAWLQSAIQHLG